MPSELTQEERSELARSIAEFHTYQLGPGSCSSLHAQRIHAPPEIVWSVVRRFDRPQTYKHFIKSCSVEEGFEMRVGCTRDVIVISGLPANTSTERLDILDDERRVTGFSIIGGEHRLTNYKSVTTVHRFERENRIWTVVLESYVVDMPEGNSEDDTRMFADTVVKLNLQKLATVTEAMARNAGDGSGSQEEETGKLSDTSVENTHKRKCKEKLTRLTQGQQDSPNDIQLIQSEKDAIFATAVKTRKKRFSRYDCIRFNDYSEYEEKYNQIQEGLAKANEEIKVLASQLPAIACWNSVMSQYFPDHVPPSRRAATQEEISKQEVITNLNDLSKI